ncbi:acyl-CoA dehydrogenase [Prauserella marina]|uniref:Acyl-CoA dehydrogenase n=1 Tax=Prauserella marina TaxID=530584 RepID=A0A222VTF4_9PSEU|nr:acyl-CoA dehydrogenase family protein [Prauserella marina]ASR37215.1 acyl-CoA dehydrogenase [Prauserella marina]PWV72535.1 alkylation response protein AidB-like acyl-CoA dehydrogenase [Prauserella marina]SDD77736.1 Acyl-CoA dehydrogenase [Prauserella marina]
MTDLLETSAIASDFRRLAAEGRLDLPLPGGGRTRDRWRALAALGARDLSLARLAEGHTDALAILAESGAKPVPGALYGVWAAKSGGTGAVLDNGVLSGTVRFCSGAHLLDRALVAAGDLLVEVDLRDERIERDERGWQAIGMAASDSADVTFDRIPVGPQDVIGGEGWYISRPGFAYGGCGVAAVWLGGCRGVVGDVSAYLRDREPDEHQLAHLGAMHTAMAASEALLERTADAIDSGAVRDAKLDTRLCRAAVEDCAMRVLAEAPKVTGPTPLCRDRSFARRHADLLVYVRQHHGERELAAIGDRLLRERGTR